MRTRTPSVAALILALFVPLFVAVPHAFAADRFWVGGSGNTNDTAHWSATSGGAGGVSVPTAADDVTFDAASSATAYTVTVPGVPFSCKNFTLGAPASGKVTVTGTQSISPAGNVDFLGGTAGIAAFSLASRVILVPPNGTTATLQTRGVTISVAPSFRIGIAGTAIGTVQLLDDLTLSTPLFELNSGTFDGNGHTVTAVQAVFSFNQGNPITLYNFSMVPTTPVTTGSLILGANLTVTNLLTISSGATLTTRIFVQSSILGTPRTITAASVSLSNVDFADITGAGAAAPFTGTSLGDTGGNSGIAFTPAVDQHWTAGSGNWSDVTRWTSRVPLPQDNVFIDVPGVQANADMPRLGRTLDWTNAPNSRMQISGNTLYGSFIGAAGMTDFPVNVSTLVFAGRGNFVLDSKGLPFRKNIFLTAPGGTLTLLSALNTGGGILQTNSGIFSAGAFPITTARIAALGGLLKLGSATHIITGNNGTQTIFGSSGATLDAETSTVKFTDSTNNPVTLDPGGGALNNVWFARGASQGNIVIKNSNTFNDFRDTGTAAHQILFFQFTTQTVRTFSVSGTPRNLITLSSGVGVTVVPATTQFGLVKTGGGQISSNYLNIQHSVATPGNTWYAGQGSINNQSVPSAGSGWIFTAPPPHFLFKGGRLLIKGGRTVIK